MRFTKNIGFLLLGIYLVLVGLVAFVPGLAIPPMLMGALAVAAGVFIIINK